MKSKFSIVVARQFFRVTAFGIAALLTSIAATAQTLDNLVDAAKPKAILVAEWTNAEPLPPPAPRHKILTVPSPARSVNNQKYADNNHANQNQVERTAAPRFRELRFASLRPTLLEEQAFALVNNERRLQKLEPLAWDLEMLYLARQHSENMAQLIFFSHAGRDGKMVDERAGEIGVRDWHSIGENIAFNEGFKNNVEVAVQNWISSPSHKQNLLSKNWRRSGIGIAETPAGKFYITQVFRD